MTLTLKSSSIPLGEQLDRLTAAYRRLRQQHAWSRHVVGAIGMIECTFNDETQKWHPHLHVLADGRFWPQAEIATAWEQATGDSRIVDIQAVHDRDRTANYIAKYVSKPPNLGNLPPERIVEWSEAVHRRRLVMTSGNLHRSTAHVADELEDTPKMEQLLTMEALNDYVRVGHERPRRAARMLWRLMDGMMKAVGMIRLSDEQAGQPLSPTEKALLAEDLRYVSRCHWHSLPPDQPANAAPREQAKSSNRINPTLFGVPPPRRPSTTHG